MHLFPYLPRLLSLMIQKMNYSPVKPHDSEDDLSFEASVANNPYYPYNQELFGRDEEDTPDLAED